MFSFILTILAPVLAFVGGLSTPNVFPNANPTPTPQSNAWQNSCYQVEPAVKLTVSREDLDRVYTAIPGQPQCYGADAPVDAPNGLIGEYTLIRRAIGLTPIKVEKEGEPYNGGCELGSAIRWVAEKTDGTKIYWEPSNFREQDIRQFVEVLAGKEGKNYVFDIYAKDTILDNLPEYITNCVESGGLVPVTEENTSIIPPQVIPLKDVIGDASINVYYANYEKFLPQSPDSFPPNGNYLIKVDKQAIPKKALYDDQGKIGEYPLTINGTSYTYEIYFHVGAFYVRDTSSQESWVYGSEAEAPPTLSGRDPSLQFKALRFRVVDSWTVFTPVCKPAIYLYPPNDISISVRIEPKGKLTETIPDYGEGWHVRATTTGQIIADKKVYPYLYYEADLTNGYEPHEGWIIAKESLKVRLAGILTTLGLNEREKDDFLTYWMPRLNNKPYYFVGFVPQTEIEKQETLTLSQNPETKIRIRLIFEGLDVPIFIQAPTLSSPQRIGFTLVDWGGSLVGKTCEGKTIQ